MRDEITGGSGQESGRQRARNPLKYFTPPKSYHGEIMLINETVDMAFRRPGNCQRWRRTVPKSWSTRPGGICLLNSKKTVIANLMSKYKSEEISETDKNRCKEGRDMTDSSTANYKGNESESAGEQASSAMPAGNKPWQRSLVALQGLRVGSHSRSLETRQRARHTDPTGGAVCAEPTLMLPESPA